MSMLLSKPRRWVGMTLLAATASGTLAAVALADRVGGDVSNEIGGITSSVNLQRGPLPEPGTEARNEDTARYWLIGQDGDGLAGCNADAEHPVTITLDAPAGMKFLVDGAYTSTPPEIVRTHCGSDVEVPADATAVPFVITDETPLGTQRIVATASGGRTYIEDGVEVHGSFPTRTVTLNIRPRDPGALTATAAKRVQVAWEASPDDADLTYYEVYRRVAGSGVRSAYLTTTDGPSLSDADVVAGTTYCYEARASFVETKEDGTTKSHVSGFTDEACAMATETGSAPSAPGAPELTAGESPNATGVFTLGWAVATDPDGDPLTYALEHRDADDADYSAVGAGLATSYAFAAPGEGEGTWTYRVRANDGTDDGFYSGPSAPVKVDKSGPNPPASSEEDEPDTADGWHRNHVTVSFDGQGDPALADGSAGSGVASVTGPVRVEESGIHQVEGTAVDEVGNVSAPTVHTAKVDATPPSLTVGGCPTRGLLFGANASINVAASDAHSGLGSLKSGSRDINPGAMRLDTWFLGTRTVTIRATDRMWGSAADDERHSAVSTCTYTVSHPLARYLPYLAKLLARWFDHVKPGQWHAVRFDLDRYAGARPFATGYPKSQAIQCGSDGDGDDGTSLSTSSYSVGYDSSTGEYVLNWKPAGATSGCRQLAVKLSDGTYRYFNVELD
jgi:hypothetical protein